MNQFDWIESSTSSVNLFCSYTPNHNNEDKSEHLFPKDEVLDNF